MKGKNHNIELFGYKFSVFNKQNFWDRKFWMTYNKAIKNIHIYESTTMKLHRVLPFTYFEVRGIVWNKEQSSFIAFNNNKNCTFKRL